jgi:hypothetical protein
MWYNLEIFAQSERIPFVMTVNIAVYGLLNAKA